MDTTASDVTSSRFLAHSKSGTGHVDSLAHHLTQVARLAEEFATPLGLAALARLAGLLHDLGKYGQRFQDRLHDPSIKNIDHWSAGAWVIQNLHKGVAQPAALAVAGHHLGLPPWSKAFEAGQALQAYPKERQLSENDPSGPYRLLIADGLADRLRMPEEVSAVKGQARSLDAEYAAAMLDTRMLYSCLVDADYLATEAHFQAPSAQEAYQRPAGPQLQAEARLELVLAHVSRVAAEAQASAEVKALRADLLEACLQAASLPPGLFTLTAPTGSGKTLAMLAFALAHAQAHGLRRVVTVIPYLTIIEQTVKVYRQALADLGEACLDQVVLEHHSLAGDPGGQKKGKDEDKTEDDDGDDLRRLLAQNWDAPLVVTTSVQFWESLFANRPGACRKLHRLAGSVILLDEVQTLPAGLAAPSLAALGRLAGRFGATVVMATATQPAFGALDKEARDLGGPGWRPREIAAPELRLFGRVRRVAVRWPRGDETMTWGQVARGMREAPAGQALAVLNLKRHAIALFQELQEQGAPGLLHLSTNLCPAHRQAVLAEVGRRLKAGEPCLLVSTQCIEAGVDLDMPMVWRAWGPLEALAQAAGRCNRGGRRPDQGELVVFRPSPEDGRRGLYPDGGYGQAAGVAQTLWQEAERLGIPLDIEDLETFTRYYQLRYAVMGSQLTSRELRQAIVAEHYPDVAKLYRLIDTATVNVLVPHHPPGQPRLYAELLEEAQRRGFALNRAWLRRARPLSVSLFRPRQDSPLVGWLEQLPAGRGRQGQTVYAEDWFILREAEGQGYHQHLGLTPPEGASFLLG